jgi:hypothetical protein
MNRTILKSGILFALASVALIAFKAQGFPPAFPREGSRKVLENSRVIIWDATWPKGKATTLHEHPVDYLSVTLVEGTVKLMQRDGTSSVATAQFGGVRFNRKGVIHAEEGVSDQERRAIMVELKTVPRRAEAAVTESGFPRNGATKGTGERAGRRVGRHVDSGSTDPEAAAGSRRCCHIPQAWCHSAISGGCGGKRHTAECR